MGRPIRDEGVRVSGKPSLSNCDALINGRDSPSNELITIRTFEALWAGLRERFWSASAAGDFHSFSGFLHSGQALTVGDVVLKQGVAT